jgi:hypothetical protein
MYTASLEQTYLVPLSGTTGRGNLDGTWQVTRAVCTIACTIQVRMMYPTKHLFFKQDTSQKPHVPESATSKVSPPSVENRHSIWHGCSNVGANAGASVTQRCPFMIDEYKLYHRYPAAFTDFSSPINISVLERCGRGTVSASRKGAVSASRVCLRRRVLCVRCKRMCSMQEEHPAPAPLSPDQVAWGSAGGNGISQGSSRRVKQEECLSILTVHPPIFSRPSSPLAILNPHC